MDVGEVLEILRTACEQAGSQASWARQNGIAASYVSDALQGRREPAGKLLEALGIERVVTYRRIGESRCRTKMGGK